VVGVAAPPFWLSAPIIGSLVAGGPSPERVIRGRVPQIGGEGGAGRADIAPTSD